MKKLLLSILASLLSLGTMKGNTDAVESVDSQDNRGHHGHSDHHHTNTYFAESEVGAVVGNSDINITYNNVEGSTVILNALLESVNVVINNGVNSIPYLLDPQQLVTYATQGADLHSITATIVSSGKVLKLNHIEMPGGFYIIRQADNHPDITGPLFGRQGEVPSDIYVVNATGAKLNFEVDYYSGVAAGCDTENGTLKHGQGQYANLKTEGCFFANVFGHVRIDDESFETNHITRDIFCLSDGIFVFRQKTGVPFSFEVVGPWRLVYPD